MARYILPRSLAVDPSESAKVRGEIIVSFHAGPLYEATYRPLGINALWELIGLVAAFGEPMCFEIKVSTAGSETIGGFANGQFCLFEVGDKNVSVVTARNVDIVGDSQVTIEDRCQGIFYWIPKSAMMSYEDLISLGNAMLLSKGGLVRTQVGQRYRNWVGDKYTEENS